jgi:GNAT superfamily N-acetyltransferase
MLGMVGRLLGRVNQILRWEGLGGLARRLSTRVFRSLIRVEHVLFFETDLARPLPPVTTRVPVDIRVVGAADLEAFAAELDGIGLRPAEVRQRLELGDVPVIATSGGILAHIQWISFRAPEVTEIDRALLLEPGRACVYEAVTLPEWRGHGIGPAVGRVSREYERERGYTHHVSWIGAGNVQSLRMIKKLDHRLTRSVWAIRTIGTARPVLLGAGRHGRPRLQRLPHRP